MGKDQSCHRSLEMLWPPKPGKLGEFPVGQADTKAFGEASRFAGWHRQQHRGVPEHSTVPGAHSALNPVGKQSQGGHSPPAPRWSHQNIPSNVPAGPCQLGAAVPGQGWELSPQPIPQWALQESTPAPRWCPHALLPTHPSPSSLPCSNHVPLLPGTAPPCQAGLRVLSSKPNSTNSPELPWAVLGAMSVLGDTKEPLKFLLQPSNAFHRRTFLLMNYFIKSFSFTGVHTDAGHLTCLNFFSLL